MLVSDLPTTWDNRLSRTGAEGNPKTSTTTPGIHPVDLVSNAVPRLCSGETSERWFTAKALLLNERPSIGLAEVLARPYPLTRRRKEEQRSTESKVLSRSIQMSKDKPERQR